MKNFLKLLGIVTVAFMIIMILQIFLNMTPESGLSALISFLFGFYMLFPYILGCTIISYLIYLLLKRIKLRPVVAGMVSALLVISGSVGWSIWQEQNHVTNQLFLIPEGYTGNIIIVYNVKGTPALEERDGYTVIPVNEQGYYVTSTYDQNYGTVTDQYVYVDQTGKRSKIDQTCVGPIGGGGFSTSENEEVNLNFSGFVLTQTECDEVFQFQNHPWGPEKSEVLGRVLKKHYGLDGF